MHRIGTDVGSTFTDLVALEEESGKFRVAKALSTKNPKYGILEDQEGRAPD